MGNTTVIFEQTRLKKDQQRKKAFKFQEINIQKRIQKAEINDKIKSRVLDATVTQLVEMLNKGSITSYFLALKVQNKCNVLTQENFNQAIQLAQLCDANRKQNPQKKNWVFGDQQHNVQIPSENSKDTSSFFSPLYGIPISIKEQIKMDGFACTVGCLSKIDNYQSDGPIMICLKNAGLIPFVRTNVPQLGMTFETVNRIYGRSLNPWNLERTVGGSSGGEGGLISGRGSPLGTGADVGGSIRIPSQFCGIYGLRVSSGRLSDQGHTQVTTSIDSGNNVQSVIGPLGKSAEDLALWLKVTLDQTYYKGQHDPYIKLIPFDQSKYFRIQKAGQHKKRIGYIRKLNILEPTAAAMRSVDQTVQRLKKIGFQMVQLQIPNQLEIVKLFLTELCAEGGMKSYKDTLNGERCIDQYQSIFTSQDYYSWFYNYKLFRMRKSMPRLAFLFQSCKPRDSVYEYYKFSNEVTKRKRQFVNYLRSNKVQLLIFPGFGCQAFPHQNVNEIFATACYTFIWNMLDLISGSMPITVVKQEQQKYETKHDDPLSMVLKRIAIGSTGLPAGIQVIGLPFMQEQVLGLMKVIEKETKFYQKHPLPTIQ